MAQEIVVKREFIPEIQRIKENVVLANDTAGEATVTVPTGERWQLLGVTMKNGDDVTRNCLCRLITLSYPFRIFIGGDILAGVTKYWPIQFVENISRGDIYLKAAEQVKFNWYAGGVSAGGTAIYSVEYLRFHP